MIDPLEPVDAPFPIWCITPLLKRAARLSDINSAISVWIVAHPEVEFIPNWYEWLHGCILVHEPHLIEWLIRLDVAYNPDNKLEYWTYGNYGPENTIVVWKRGVRPSLKESYER